MSNSWLEPPQWPALGDTEAHVWLAHLPSARGELARLTDVLSANERGRARRFRSEEYRERTQLTRGLLRLLLARYLEDVAHDARLANRAHDSGGKVESLALRGGFARASGRSATASTWPRFTERARAIAFRQNAHGKPALEHPAGTGIFFNVSHSGDYAAFGVTRLGEIGVDLERVRDDWPRREEIARRYFTPGEHEALRSQPEAERARAFFELWTRKEAFVKARGDGVFSGLDQFEVSPAAPRVVSIAGEPAAAANWWMSTLPPLDGYAGTVVVNKSSCSPRFWKWSARWLDANTTSLPTFNS